MVPRVEMETKLQDGLLEMTNKRFGCTAVVDNKGTVKGIFTDGDLRRLIEKNENPFSQKMKDIMTEGPVTTKEDELVMKALEVMEEKAITVLLVLDEKKMPKGIIHLHDILKSGVV